MTDDADDKQPWPSSRRPAPDEESSPAEDRRERSAPVTSDPQPPGDDDPLAALERLESLTPATTAPTGAESPTAPRRPSTAVPPASRPRPAAAPRAGRMVARIAAPVAFLVAVVVLISILSQSGVIGGQTEPVVAPTPAATKTKSRGTASPSGYKVYVVKSGDTISGIAVKFGVSTSELEALNPKLRSSSLGIGMTVKVPKPIP